MKKLWSAVQRKLHLFHGIGLDLLLAAIASVHVILVPYTKVEESFNIQAMHDIIVHHYHLEKYDHFQFPGVVPRTFVGAFFVSLLSAPFAMIISLFTSSKIYNLFLVRFILGSIVLSTLCYLRVQVRRKFGQEVSAFFAIMLAVQFHLLFYCTRPLPNIFALAIVNLAYAFWIKEKPLVTLGLLTFATTVFRCDTILLTGPIGIYFLLSRKIKFWDAFKYCTIAAILSIALTMCVDSLMWKRIIWPEMEVFWFNSVLNRSSEWGVAPVHWYFTSALPRSMLAAFPLCFLGMVLERRLLQYVLPVLTFVIVYSKLPHKELRFIIFVIPMLNISAAAAAARIYNNRKKNTWKWLYFAVIVSLFASIGFTVLMSGASYANYPAGHALFALHETDSSRSSPSIVHIDSFSAMNGISRFCERNYPWSYSKEEHLPMEELSTKNFTYLLSEHRVIPGYKCLLAVSGFSRVAIKYSIPSVQLITEPKVFVHGSLNDSSIEELKWPGCPIDL